jgi:hypothetical protein
MKMDVIGALVMSVGAICFGLGIWFPRFRWTWGGTHVASGPLTRVGAALFFASCGTAILDSSLPGRHGFLYAASAVVGWTLVPVSGALAMLNARHYWKAGFFSAFVAVGIAFLSVIGFVFVAAK